MGYFKVKAKCGHVRRNNYIIKDFYISAESGKEAARLIRLRPRVKHHNKKAIISVNKITFEQYVEGLAETKNDMYFQVSNSSEQKEKCYFAPGEIIREEIEEDYRKPTHLKQRLINNLIIKEWKNRREFAYEQN